MDTAPEEDVNIYKIMTTYGVNEIVEIIKSYSIIYLNNDFFNPPNKNISKYVDAFEYICNNDKIPINYIIDVVKVLSQNSKNGKIYIINIYKTKIIIKSSIA